MATSEGRGRLRAPPLGEPYGFMLLQQVQEDRKTTQSAVEGWVGGGGRGHTYRRNVCNCRNRKAVCVCVFRTMTTLPNGAGSESGSAYRCLFFLPTCPENDENKKEKKKKTSLMKWPFANNSTLYRFLKHASFKLDFSISLFFYFRRKDDSLPGSLSAVRMPRGQSETNSNVKIKAPV